MKTAQKISVGIFVFGLAITAYLTAVPGKIGAQVLKDQPPKLPMKKELMEKKLKLSQAILEGIALDNMNKIQSSAEELVRVSEAAEFLNAYKGKEYELQMLMFRRAVDTIAKKAKDKNIDGVMISYTEMTLTCLKCHQATRDMKDASIDLPKIGYQD